MAALRLATEHIRFIHFSCVRLLPSRLVPARRVPGLTVLEFLHNLRGARNRIVICLSYRPARLRSLAELVPWDRFLGSLKVWRSRFCSPYTCLGHVMQCCGSGAGDRDGTKIRIQDPGITSRIIFPRALKEFFWLKIFKSFMRIRIRDLFDPGSGIRDGKIRIWDPR